jgi:hypothetical protein
MRDFSLRKHLLTDSTDVAEKSSLAFQLPCKIINQTSVELHADCIDDTKIICAIRDVCGQINCLKRCEHSYS